MRIGSTDYKELLLLTENSTLLARITDEQIIETKAVKIIGIPSASGQEAIFQECDDGKSISVLFYEGHLPG